MRLEELLGLVRGFCGEDVEHKVYGELAVRREKLISQFIQGNIASLDLGSVEGLMDEIEARIKKRASVEVSRAPYGETYITKKLEDVSH